mmetsp:Transcript_52158/g.86506  ORF Transcript_52158/g.86506 Transcript_52158/m.86506 type:complete len:91 (+) Transcript_52158:355-627(+)
MLHSENKNSKTRWMHMTALFPKATRLTLLLLWQLRRAQHNHTWGMFSYGTSRCCRHLMSKVTPSYKAKVYIQGSYARTWERAGQAKVLQW